MKWPFIRASVARKAMLCAALLLLAANFIGSEWLVLWMVRAAIAVFFVLCFFALTGIAESPEREQMRLEKERKERLAKEAYEREFIGRQHFDP